MELSDAVYTNETLGYVNTNDFWFAGNDAPWYEGAFYADGMCCAKWNDGTPADIFLTDFSPNGYVMTCRSLAKAGTFVKSLEISQVADELTSGEMMGFGCLATLSDGTVTNVTDAAEWSLSDASDSDIAGFTKPNGFFYADFSKSGAEEDRTVTVKAKWTCGGRISWCESSVTIHAKPRLARIWVEGPKDVKTGDVEVMRAEGGGYQAVARFLVSGKTIEVPWQ